MLKIQPENPLTSHALIESVVSVGSEEVQPARVFKYRVRLSVMRRKLKLSSAFPQVWRRPVQCLY